MAATVSAASGSRYAPEDPTLPKPWKGLVDGKTGYLYFWNPETNVTQYERPVTSSAPTSSPALPKPASTPISSSVQIHQSPQGQYRSSTKEVNGRYNGDSNGGSKLQSMRGGSSHSDNVPNGSVSSGHAGTSARGHGTDMGSSSSVESYRRQHEITVSGDDVPPPFMSFESSGFPSEILREVQQAGFSAPTPIQAQSWPIALQSRDIVAVAKTGSGKTLGYLVPGFVHLKRCRNNSQMGPTVLVLSPTRELATQIQAEAVKFGRSSRISCTCLYGGAPKGPQLREIERGADIVVATPGRLNDILEMRKISLRQVSYLVLDEADRMLDMGFEPQIRKIVEEIPSRRQTLMYTATWPKEVRKIAADLLVKPVQVNIGSIDELVANKSITQYVEMVPPMEKQRRLEQILRSQEPGSKVIIFCSTKKMCDQLARTITRHFGVAVIHGDKSQGERDYVLSQFRSGKSPILVATDVAARGLDVKDIRVVVNYDFPTGVEDYVHRIGRTGRAGATGVAYTFLSDQDAKYASELIKVLEGADQRVPPQIRDLASRGGGMNKFRRWGSAPGGRDGSRGGRFESSNSSYGGGRGGGRFESNNSSYGGGRGGRAPPSSDRSDREHGRGYDREPRDRYDDDSRVSFHQKAYGANNGDRRTGERDRVLSRSRSPNKGRNGGWGGYNTRSRSRSRSRSLNRDRSRSRSRSPDRYRVIQPNAQRTRGSPPRQGSHNDDPPQQQSLPSSYSGEEEEEGMIPAEPEEEGLIPADDDGPRNPKDPILLD